jgi:hypothetical protein
MSASNHALAWDNLPVQIDVKAQAAAPAISLPEPPAASAAPALRVMPLLRGPQPRRFVRVPTHVVGVHMEQRECPRASLRLPLKLRSVGGVLENYPVTLVTRDIVLPECFSSAQRLWQRKPKLSWILYWLAARSVMETWWSRPERT